MSYMVVCGGGVVGSVLGVCVAVGVGCRKFCCDKHVIFILLPHALP